jgi:hypothetical protein
LSLLLLCVATAVLCVRSDAGSDDTMGDNRASTCGNANGRGPPTRGSAATMSKVRCCNLVANRPAAAGDKS